MLASVVFVLRPKHAANLPAVTGPAVQAWFLDLVRTYEPSLAEMLHRPNEERPYTTSSLIAPDARDAESIPVSSATRLIFRVTTLTNALTTLLATQIIPHLSDHITLLNLDFDVVGVAAHPDEHVWANTTTYDDLMQIPQQSDCPRRALTLHYLSPTAFRSQGILLLFPEPRLVFGSLARRWTKFAPTATPPEFAEYLTRGIGVHSYSLSTKQVRFGMRGEFNAFQGHCRYAFLAQDPVMQVWAYRLSQFANFAGVGWRTAMGLGQVRYE